MAKKHEKLSSTKNINLAKRGRPPRSLPWYKRIRTSVIVFLCGIMLLSISVAYHVEQLVNLSFYHQHIPVTTHHQTPRAVEIRIDKVDLDLPVLETVIANNTWEIADNGISHLSISSHPGEDGTIIIYGHNTNDRFGPIRWLSVGDTIVLTNTQNQTYTYAIQKIVTVDPNDTKILTSQKGETLILYTCTGFADLQRYVVIAKPKK